MTNRVRSPELSGNYRNPCPGICETRKLEHSPAPDPVVFHPSMAEAYRERVTRRIKGLGTAEGMVEAKEALRALVERIVLAPAAEGPGLDLTLEGDLAGLLRLAAGAAGANAGKAPGVMPEAFEGIEEIVLVAGAGNRRILPALSAKI
ncbi:hypothetical protein [Leisingera sp.]|uniref:hypothetical protein n=1 Tax=Leisingera sp. TaxID=1879318 RepID=UPI002B266917|nr:hypothetical protein [Leisingera sp.]